MKDKSKAKRIVSQDGLNIYYWVNWNTDLKNNFVVLQPGSSMNHSSLEGLEKGFNERGNPTIVIDPRGFGYSDAPGNSKSYQLEKYSDDLERIIGQEELEDPTLVGHSFSFMYTVDYASRTNNADRLIGICGSYSFPETTGNKALFHLFNRVLRYGEYAGSIGTKIAHAVKGEERTLPDMSNRNESDFGMYLKIVDVPIKNITAHIVSALEINRWDVSKQLGELKIPSLLIYGDNDIMVKPIAGEYISGKSRADCQIEILNGDHSLPIKNPEGVLKVVDRYLNRGKK